MVFYFLSTRIFKFVDFFPVGSTANWIWIGYVTRRIYCVYT